MTQITYHPVNPYDQWILDRDGSLCGIRIAGRNAPTSDYLIQSDRSNGSRTEFTK